MPRVPPRGGAIGPPPPLDDRRTTIAKVLAVWPHEIEDETLAGRERLLTRLRSALRAERRRGISGHWTYDLNRHIGLRQAYIAEKRPGSAIRRGLDAKKPSPTGDASKQD